MNAEDVFFITLLALVVAIAFGIQALNNYGQARWDQHVREHILDARK